MQNGGLMYQLPAVLRIVKATEILFQRVIEQVTGINTDKNLNIKLQSAVFH